MSLNEYSVSSPTRVDLAGGTLDLWPLWAFHAPCVTINYSVNIFTHVKLRERSDSVVTITIKDLGFQKTYKGISEFIAETHPDVGLLKTHVDYWNPRLGFDLETQSESPLGGGLGGSSSLSISLIKVFAAWLKKDFSPYELVTLAGNLEARFLNTLTGIQDYFPAIEGGLHSIEFTSLGPKWRRLSIPEEIFSNRAFLVYTGKPHKSGINNWQVLKLAVEKNEATVKALEGLKKVSEQTLRTVEKGDWERLPELLEQEYAHRIQLSEVFTSPEIRKLREHAMSKGAQAVKICGAGGGGCVLVWCKENDKHRIQEECQKNGFQVLGDVRPVARVQPVQIKPI